MPSSEAMRAAQDDLAQKDATMNSLQAAISDHQEVLNDQSGDDIDSVSATQDAQHHMNITDVIAALYSLPGMLQRILTAKNNTPQQSPLDIQQTRLKAKATLHKARKMAREFLEDTDSVEENGMLIPAEGELKKVQRSLLLSTSRTHPYALLQKNRAV
jgi:hypothetical protein